MHFIAKRTVTLIEMMIVMFLIIMIIGVVAYNFQGTLDEGKAFKTKTSIDKLQTILTIIVSDDPNKLDRIDTEWQTYVRTSPLVSNPNDLIYDGWGNEYTVSVIDGRVRVSSEPFQKYVQENPGTMFGGEREEP